VPPNPPRPARHGSAEPLWRAIAVFRFASLGYAALLVVLNRGDYARFGWAWAVRYGRRAGTATALVVSGCDFALRHGDITVVLNGVVLLLLAGWTIGHVARLAAEVETERQHAAAVEATSRERERLARDIHDSVLQVLALVQRRGAEAGGEAAELGRLAGQQEAALRSLVGGTPPATAPAAGDDVDLSALVLAGQAERVTVSVPAQAVRLEKWRRRSWPQRSVRPWTTYGGMAASGPAPGSSSRTSRPWSR
jgi:hypothetical protein